MAQALDERVLLAIFRRFPPIETIFKATPGRPESEYASEAALSFSAYFDRSPEMMFGRRHVLDLGCGFGGRPVRFAECGARSVVGVEIAEELVVAARYFAASHGLRNTDFRVGTGEAIPADDASFDLITMYDVLEHVVDPVATLRECRRVLRPGGQLATVFPPYYSIRAGSHLHGYATTFPGLNIVFPTRSLRRAAAAKMEADGHDYHQYLREVSTDRLWNMNGLTVRGFNRIVGDLGFERADVRYFAEIDHREPRLPGTGRLRRLRRPPISYLMVWPAQIPVVREVWCSRVVALLTR